MTFRPLGTPSCFVEAWLNGTPKGNCPPVLTHTHNPLEHLRREPWESIAAKLEPSVPLPQKIYETLFNQGLEPGTRKAFSWLQTVYSIWANPNSQGWRAMQPHLLSGSKPMRGQHGGQQT